VIVLVLVLGAVGLFLLVRSDAAHQAYPEYSSLRSDPDGTKVLYESLERLAEMKVSRSYRPWRNFEGPRGAVLYLGMRVSWLGVSLDRFLKDAERAARQGQRVVIGLVSIDETDVMPDEAGRELWTRWGVRLKASPRKRLPPLLTLETNSDWSVMERRGQAAVMAEKAVGPGWLVVAADARAFTNGAQAVRPRGEMVSRALGDRRVVVFEEHHLGVTEQGSVMGLALRYRMSGFLLASLGWAGLFVWKSSGAFPPRRPDRAEQARTGRASMAGLATLVARNLAPAELARAAMEEWRRTAARTYSKKTMEQAQQAFDAAPGGPAGKLAAAHASLPRRRDGKGQA
jgi:hypothetical protein